MLFNKYIINGELKTSNKNLVQNHYICSSRKLFSINDSLYSRKA